MLDIAIMLAVLIISFTVGYLLISRVPPLLHTPLMSMTNAISAITIIAGIVLFSMEMSVTETLLGCVAVATAAFNVFGGFLITDRMTRLFRKQDAHDESAEKKEKAGEAL